jgi:fructose/tagatose bisphosphate aldolase
MASLNSSLEEPEPPWKTKKTGYFSIAAGFGNVHGVYKPGNVKLHPELLSKHQKYLGLSVEGVVVNILVVDTVLLTTGDTDLL